MRAYRVAYDGRGYHGFQRQPDVATIEDTLLDALRGLGVCETVPEGYAAAGRTDAGVSALAQTVAFEAPDWLSPQAFTSGLPADVWVYASAPAPDGFHATHDARAREYTYYLHAPEASEARAREALETLSGEHDFHNLTPDDDGTVRELETALHRDGEWLVLVLRADGFARQLVRRVVSVVAEIARGEAGDERLQRVLAAEPLSGPAGVAPAPAYPLVLTDVAYDLAFAVDETVATRAREAFAGRQVEQATRARVAETLADGV